MDSGVARLQIDPDEVVRHTIELVKNQ
jgi:hypothetical protein